MFRLLWVIMWALALVVCTCTHNLNALLFHRTVHFTWAHNPHFSDLLIISDAHVNDPYWLFIKSGHFVGFAIMEWLLFRLTQKRGLSAVAVILFAISTEIFQLYFGRDGRFLDMGIDSLGVAISYLIQRRRYAISTEKLIEQHLRRQ
jgi:VanZ family protein